MVDWIDDCVIDYGVEGSINRDNAGNYQSLEIKIRMKGPTTVKGFQYSLNTPGMSNFNSSFNSLELSCDTSDTLKAIITKDQWKLANDSVLVDPNFMCRQINFAFTIDSDSATRRRVFTPTLSTVPVCDPPDDKPFLAVSDFDETTCSNIDTITYTKTTGYTYEVTLYASKQALAKVAAGEQQILSNGRPITGGIDTTNNTYAWISDLDAKKGDTCYFQVGLQRESKNCELSNEVKSNIVVKTDISCKGINVSIKNIKDKNKQTINKKVAVKPKIDGPFTIEVEAREDDTKWPDTVTLEISYAPNDDKARAEFYSARRAGNVIKTIKIEPDHKDTSCIYPVAWNGRDDIANRVLLGGKYTLKATAQFGTKKASHSSEITIASPELISEACNYPGADTAAINRFIAAYDSGWFVFNHDSVPFLYEEPDTAKFNWLREFGIIGGDVATKDYIVTKTTGNSISTTSIDNIKDNYAVYSWIGHAGIRDTTPFLPWLKFTNNYLFAGCGAYTSTGNICLDKTAGGVQRDTKCSADTSKKLLWMDDVLLAVLMGCRTNVDGDSSHPSMAKQMIGHGVDCVIGTKRRVYLPLMVFWYYHFYERLFDKKLTMTIENASKIAYELALKDIVCLHPACKTGSNWWNPAIPADLIKIIDYFSPEIDYYDQTIDRINNQNNKANGDSVSVLTTSILPPRFGSMKPCPNGE